MKILFVLDLYGLFGNPTSGGAHRNTLFVKSLAQLGHVDVCSFIKETVVSDIQNCNVVYSNPIKTEGGNIYVRSFLSILRMSIKPSNPNSYYVTNKEKEKVIDGLVSKNGYDFIACRYIQTAAKCGLLKYGTKLVIDVDDNPANSLRNIAASSSSLLLKLKNYYTAFFISLMVKKVLGRVFCSFYSNILEPPSPSSTFLHNTVKTVNSVPDILPSTKNRIIFVGVLDYPPNKFGINHFVLNIFPMIKQRITDAELYIIGKGSQNILNEFNQIEGVKALGFVDDIVAEYVKSKLVVIPIYHGSGTCIKFVEGMFMNRPIVSTSVGARGFNQIVKEGDHFFMANNDEDFANKTIELLTSFPKSKKMADKAYKVACKYLSQEKFMEIVKETIEGKTN